LFDLITTFIWILIAFPLTKILFLGFFQDAFLANPTEFILLETGEAGVLFLVITLWISPLRSIPPIWKKVRWLAKYRRRLGLASFVYIQIHLIFFLLDKLSGVTSLQSEILRPFIFFGFLGYITLLILALTSSNRAIKKLGAKRWKKLHRIVYFTAIVVFIHMIYKEKTSPVYALTFFLPLLLGETYRVIRFRQK
jgi:sulfoxide reductase heme-binding subunit YedZ